MAGSLKTYSHLLALRRKPSEYEVVTSGLLYYPGRGFETSVPLAAWYERFQTECPLACDDWDEFRDPRATTYTKYTALQRDREIFVDGLLRSIEESDYDSRLAPEWLGCLERVLSPARYLGHGLQMLAAYVGQMAPSGRITITAALQCGDEMRRLQRFAYRMAQLARVRQGFGAGGKGLWLEHDAWQPARRLLEELLVTYDWGEAMTALNLCLKPALDDWLLVELAELARERGDYLFAEICASLDADARWHREWSAALVRHAVSRRPENGAVLDGFVRRFWPRAEQAVRALPALLDGATSAERSVTRGRQFLATLGLAP